MSITCICPNCSESVTLSSRPIENCPNCKKSFPKGLKEKLNTNFQIQRPGFLSLIYYFNYFFLIILAMMIVMTILIPGGNYTLNGQEVSRSEFIVYGFPQMGIIGVLVFIVTRGLKLNKPWTRPLLFSMMFIPYLTLSYQFLTSPFNELTIEHRLTMFVPAILFLSLFVVIAYLYFFKKTNVVEYYKELQFEQVAGGDATR